MSFTTSASVLPGQRLTGTLGPLAVDADGNGVVISYVALVVRVSSKPGGRGRRLLAEALFERLEFGLPRRVDGMGEFEGSARRLD